MCNTLFDSQSPSDVQATTQLDELKALSFRFLRNMKARFGEQSPQLYDVHETLDAFQKGRLSKRLAHTTILETLEGYDDLRQELMDILMHPVAEWAPGDFDLPTEQSTQAFLEPTPQFLQPAHQPQIRLPSISSSWFPLPQVDQSAGLTMFNGYSGHSPMASCPPLPVLAPFNPPAQLWTDRSAKATYTAVDEDGSVPPPIHTAFRNPWEDSSYAGTWTDDGTKFPSNSTYVDEHFELQGSPDLSYSNNLQPSLTYSQDVESHSRQGFPRRETPQSMHTPQLTYDLLPSPTSYDPFHVTTLEEQRPADVLAPPTPTSHSPPDVQQIEDAEKLGQDSTTNQNDTLGGPYIHALCGKGFATPSKVKKHHWGKKHNDLATTTGCWAKHKKPNVAWDDHPSCKDGRSTWETTKSVPSMSKHIKPKASISQPKTSAAFDVPQHNTIPGFPTLDDLPQMVAKTLNTGNVTISSPQGQQPHYHTHRLPSRSSFDTLLTAVNVVSQIDAPKPQGWTDSIALHLDAQVGAAEGYNQHTPFIPSVPLTSSFDPCYVRPVAPTALDTTDPSMGESSPPSMSVPLMKHGSDEQQSVLPSDVEESYVAAASSRPLKPHGALPSGPARKKRKV